MASAGDIERDWLPALELWQQIHGEKTQERIRRAVKFARGDNPDEKRYTLKSPKSLMTIMANLQSVQAERKARMVSAK